MSAVDARAADDAPANEGGDGGEDDDSDAGGDDDDGEGDDSGGEGDPMLARALNAIDDEADDFDLSDDAEDLVIGENSTPETRRNDRKHYKQDYLLSTEQRKYLCAVFSEHHRERREGQKLSLSRTVSFSRDCFHHQAAALGHSTIEPRTCKAKRACTARSPR